jgi:hypothetical protein
LRCRTRCNTSQKNKARRLAKLSGKEKKPSTILRVHDVRLLSRETIDGQPSILCASRRARPPPPDNDGKMLKKFGGRAWFDEQDYELVKAEVQVLDDLTYGLGVLARLHQGSRLEIRRRKINNEVWLPAEIRYQLSARIALFKRIRAEGVSTYSDYKKFSVPSTTFDAEGAGRPTFRSAQGAGSTDCLLGARRAIEM